jgi:hypothetical protein
VPSGVRLGHDHGHSANILSRHRSMRMILATPPHAFWQLRLCHLLVERELGAALAARTPKRQEPTQLKTFSLHWLGRLQGEKRLPIGCLYNAWRCSLLNIRYIHADSPEGFAVAGEKALPVILSVSTGRHCPFLRFWLNRWTPLSMTQPAQLGY